MQPVFAVRVALELGLPPLVVFSLALLTLRLVRRLAPQSSLGRIRPGVFLLVGSAQLIVYVVLFAAAFELGENTGAVPATLAVPVTIVGFPLMLFSDSVDSLFCPSIRAGTALFTLLASVNATVWATAICWISSKFRRQAHVA
jgi:hypothetical protein